MTGKKNRLRRASDTSLFAVFPTQVSAVQKLSENYVRITLTGESLKKLSRTAADDSPNLYDAYIKLLIPPPGATAATDIDLTDENWRTDWFSQPETERGWMRTYTIRARRDEGAAGLPEIDIDFVLHQDAEGKMGPGADWAAQAQVGRPISFMGPVDGGAEAFSPLWTSWAGHDAQRLIIAADETAVPAACSILISLQPEQQADLLLEVPGEGDVLTDAQALLEPALGKLPNVRVHWLPRGCNGSSAVRGEELYRKLRELLDIAPIVEYRLVEEDENDDSFVWDVSEGDGDYYVFIAGESSVIKTLRRICVNDAGLDKANVSFMGYWKKGRAES